MDNSDSSFTLPLAVIELIKRMTPEEKQQFSSLLNMQELQKHDNEKTSSNGKRYGDPKFYLGTTPRGLNLEIPKEQINAVLKLFLHELAPKNIELFISGSQDFREVKLSPEDFHTLFSTDPKYFRENHILIEMDDNELTSAGEGCMSITLCPSMMAKRNELATKILATCGYSHKFKNETFYAIDWDKKLEVNENEENR